MATFVNRYVPILTLERPLDQGDPREPVISQSWAGAPRLKRRSEWNRFH